MDPAYLASLRRDLCAKGREAGVWDAHGLPAKVRQLNQSIEFWLRSIPEPERWEVSADVSAHEHVSRERIRVARRETLPGAHLPTLEEMRRAYWYRPCVDRETVELAAEIAKLGPCRCMMCMRWPR